MRKTVFLLLSIFLLFILLAGLIVCTDTGLLVIKKTANRVCSEFLTIRSVKGKLAGEWSLRGLKVELEGVAVSVGEVECSLRPVKLFSGEFDFAKLAVRDTKVTFKSGAEEVSSDSPLVLPKLFLPFVFVVNEVSIKNLSLVADGGSEIVRIENGGFELNWQGYQVGLNDFFLEASEFGFKSHGFLDTRHGWSLDLAGGYRFSMGGVNNLAGTYSVKGPVDNLVVDLGLHHPAAVRANGTVINLLDDLHWEVVVNGTDVDLSSFHGVMPEIQLTKAVVHASGGLEGYSGDVQADGSWDDLKNIHLVSKLSADWLGIDFQSLHLVSGEKTALAEDSWISWDDTFRWGGHFIFKNFNPAIITDEIPGRIDADLRSIGKVVENGVEASFEIAALDGILRQQQIAVQGDVFLTEYEVYSNGLLVQSGDFSGKALMHHGRFSWADPFSWAGDISFDNFDPSPFYSELFGQISGRVNGELQHLETGAEGYLTIGELSGMLRDRPISGGGNIQIKNGRLQTEGIELKHGGSELQVSGTAGDLFALNFSLSSPDIGQLIPRGSGAVFINGKMAGTPRKPELSVVLQAGNLVYREHSVAGLDGRFEGGISSGQKFKGFLQGKGISSAGILLDTTAVEISGTFEEHTMLLQLSSDYGKSQLKANGGYKGKLWQGELYDINHRSASYGNVEQRQPAQLFAGGNSFKLANFCLEDGEGEFCLNGELNTVEEDFYWQVKGSLNGIALPWLNWTQLLSIPVNGVINGQLEAEGDNKEVVSAKIRFEFPEADFEIVQAEEELRHIKLDDTVITGILSDGRFLGFLSSSMGNKSLLRLSTEIENFGKFSSAGEDLLLTGDLYIREFDLTFLEPFTGYWVEPIGKMDGSLSLSGSLTQPKASGELKIINGGIDLPYQGVTLEDVTFRVSAEEQGARISCEASSGPGKIAVSGQLKYGGDSVSGDLLIRGEEFLLFSLPEYEIRVTPDARFLFSKDKGEFSGTVKIPYALITPEEMTSSVTVSSDVILVNGGEELVEQQWPVFINMHVQLGEDVRVDGYGLKGRLEGGLEVLDQPDSFLAGTGELSLIDGTFTVYGRSFDIERGRVLFTGGPIDNPGIDARAQKTVSAEEAVGDGYVVGVDVNGLVQDLKFHLFSDPFMEDADILSHLLIGRSTSGSSEAESNLLEATAVALGVNGGTEIGKGLGNILSVDDLHLEGSGEKEDMSLVVGKRITKKLYFGYDMNMFSQLGVFRVRYGLAHGFSVETQTSTEATGTDLLYTFER